MSKSKKLIKCKTCSKEFYPYYGIKTPHVYCSVQCKHDLDSMERYARFLQDENLVYKTPRTTRNALIIRDGWKCAECGIKDWNGKPLMLEVEHIDGNYLNHRSSNLKLICPNCHSQTPTFRAKNKGNGREFRRKNFVKKPD